MVFPNVYHLGMSNLGLQLVYGLLNEHPQIVCERIFLPDSPLPPRSIESSRPLSDFPVILFAVSFEQDFVNVLRLLHSAFIAPYSQERGDENQISTKSPLIICGGVATFINPEPLAPFMDMFLLGEAEEMFDDFLDTLLRSSENGFVSRKALLLEMAQKVKGCYVPRFYKMNYDKDQLYSISTLENVPYPVPKATYTSTEKAGHSLILTPDTEFSDLFLAELGRGCSRGCRFCAAGFVYRPPRLWTAEAIKRALAQKPEAIQRVGLLGMEMARADDLAEVAREMIHMNCQLSFSSLRADAISEDLLGLLRSSGLKTSAIAPDGASERLRRVINKGISEDDIMWAAEALVKSGVTNLKLYFMIGLPSETDEDLNELADLVFKVRGKIEPVGRRRGRLAEITVSLNSFVPKAWTPFQFCAFAGVPALKAKIKILKKKFAGQSNIRMNVDKPDNAFYQAVLARGDRKIGEILLQLSLSSQNWRQLFRRQNLRPEDYTRERGKDEVFPWEIVGHSIKRDYLWAEYQRALSEKRTAPCDTEACRRCGVCRGK